MYNLFCNIAAKLVEKNDAARFNTHVETSQNSLPYAKALSTVAWRPRAILTHQTDEKLEI